MKKFATENKQYFFRLIFGLCCLFGAHSAALAQDIYADQMINHSADFQNTSKIVDADHTNYGFVSNAVSLLSTSYLEVGFPVNGAAGDVMNVIVKGTGQVLGVGLLNATTIKLYDATGTLVKTASGTNLLQLSLLAPGTDIYSIRFATDITDDYTFKTARIEFNNLLTVNLLNQFRVYGVYFQQSCPPVYADAVYEYKTGGLLTSYVSNPQHAVSPGQNDAAKLVVPLNLLSLLPPAYLDLSFSSVGRAGEYVGFTIGESSSVLDLSLLQNIKINVYDENGVLKDAKNGFNLLDLKLLPGTGNKYSIGFITQSGNYNIGRVRIILSATVALFEDLDVYNAFHFEIDRPPVIIDVNGNTTLCPGESVTLTAYDSLGGTSYLWNTGATTQSITVTQAGTYYVQVTDALSCTRYSIPIKVKVAANPQPKIEGDTVLCPGGAGLLQLQQNYASRTWSDNSTGASLSIQGPGQYYVTVANASGCVGSDTVQVVTNELSIVPNIVSAGCSNTASGSIALNVTGGSGNYAYDWSNGKTTATNNNIAPGLYAAVITDNTYGCAYNRSFTVTADGNLSSKVTVINTSGCNEADGSIMETVIGGSGQYQYAWSNGATTASLQDIAAGIYTVTITDVTTNCILKDTVMVSDGNSGLDSNPVVTNATSCSSPDGSIDLNISGGSGNYSYLWANGATSASISGLSAGIYRVLVTDDNAQCSRAFRIAVENDGRLNINGSVTAANCLGSNGSIALTVGGGSGNYTYDWFTGQHTPTVNNLQSGTYIVTVSDNISGCSSKEAFTVGETGGPVALLTVTQPECSSNGNGAIHVSASGSGLEYNWSNGSSQKNQTNLKPGRYVLTVTKSATGCSSVYSALLKAPAQIDLAATVTANTSCLNNANGAIHLAPYGGTTPYSYSWSNGATTRNITGLDPDTYSLTMTDANGCTADLTATVVTDSAGLLQISQTSMQNASCNNAANGNVHISVSGGQQPYDYLWSNGDTTKNLIDALPGNYTVTVTDHLGCTSDLQVTVGIDSLNALMVQIDSVVNTACDNVAAGAVFITASGGTQPYQYAWSNGATSRNIDHLTPGSYTVTVTDSFGCTAMATTSVAIDSLHQLKVVTDSIVDVTCHDTLAGGIWVTPSGGVQPYNYQWSNGATTQDISGIGAGDYLLTVTDHQGCTADLSATVAAPDPILLDVDQQDISCYGAADGSITVQATGGSGIYRYEWNTGAAGDALSGLSAGTYTVVVTDSITGCSATNTYTILEPDSLMIHAMVINDTCLTEAVDGKIILNVSGGTLPYAYSWSNGSTESMIDGLMPGVYSVTVTDDHNCSKDWQGTVNATECDFTLEIYDVITPNGDGANDKWVIRGLEYYPNNQVIVFDKWGDKVFDQSNYDGTWRGTRGSHGDPLPDGTYFYLIKLNDANHQGGKNVFTGSLLIQR